MGLSPYKFTPMSRLHHVIRGMRKEVGLVFCQRLDRAGDDDFVPDAFALGMSLRVLLVSSVMA
jgi:hypothetical protein